MALNLEAIHRALAAQIRAGIARDTNVYPFPVEDPQYPCVSIYPDSIDYFTSFGPNGTADLNLRLKLEVSADSAESAAIKVCDYLSVGTGNGSSIIDAVHADRTLGGIVDDCVVREAEWPAESDLGLAWLPVLIFLTKQNAEV